MAYDITKTELVWPGKYDEKGKRVEPPRVNLPFQVIERVNESRASRETKKAKGLTLFDAYEGDEGETFEDGWRNKLIWGDNALVMSSLLNQFAGKIDLIYIDPPFATGADFGFMAEIGEGGLTVAKEQSAIEEKAYRDTWGHGRSSYLSMMAGRLELCRGLLAESGCLFLHCDWHASGLLRCLLDEVFGPDAILNEIVWSYALGGSARDRYQRKHDTLLFYAKNPGGHYFDQPQDAATSSLLAGQPKGARDVWRTSFEDAHSTLLDAWEDDLIEFTLSNRDPERWGFPTQKPEAVLRRVIEGSCPEGGLVADFFSGSGTTAVVAEKLGRRWIGCDLGRYAVHVARKRLLEIPDCRAFEVLNLGQYERQYWQAATFGEDTDGDGNLSILEYIAFILELYGARPTGSSANLHGQRGKAFVHVGAVESPVTMQEVAVAVEECLAMKGSEIHVLGWEWEMGLNDTMTDLARGKGVKLLLRQIPREVMEVEAAAKGNVTFHELAYLDAEVKKNKDQREYEVRLNDFLIPNPDLIPEEVRKKIKKWSDFVDYWAVDWNFSDDTFMQGWVTYRTRRDRSLALKSDPHAYEAVGEYSVMVKVIDIFGNDTSKILDIEVR